MRDLPASFYAAPVTTVARRLLGKGLVVGHGGKSRVAEIVEVEAYRRDDPASHSFRGETARNASMFRGGGTCYVYLIYGMYHCLNVVTGEPGAGHAVLIRAAAPLSGFGAVHRSILSGPGKLCRELGIDLSLDGLRFGADSGLRLVELGQSIPAGRIGTGPRIGITKGAETPWRFLLKDSDSLSRRL